jgi:hypothetical protein
MDTKHLLTGIAIFILIALTLYYLGGLLANLEKNMSESKEKEPPPLVEVLEMTKELKIQTQEYQKRQEEILNLHQK